MATRITRRSLKLNDIIERDEREAKAAAQDAVVARALRLAPYSYAEMAHARRELTLGYLLSELPDHLVRSQAIRFLVERHAAYPHMLWGWGDVDHVESVFRRAAAEWAANVGPVAQTALDVRDESAAAANEDMPSRLLARLASIEASAEAQVPLAQADGDADLVRVARRTAKAARDAAGLVAEGNGWHDGGNGTLLVASRSRKGVWQRVGRDSEGRVQCSCEWTGFGPCAHKALFEAWEAER